MPRYIFHAGEVTVQVLGEDWTFQLWLGIESEETQSIFRFSHAELECRMRTLEENNQTLAETQRTIEETVADLQARVERLEGFTH